MPKIKQTQEIKNILDLPCGTVSIQQGLVC